MEQTKGIQLTEKECRILGRGLICLKQNLQTERKEMEYCPKPGGNIESYTELIEYTKTLYEKMDIHETEIHNITQLAGDKDSLKLPGHWGTWHVADETHHQGRRVYLLEHSTHGDAAAYAIIDSTGKLLLDDVHNGFNDLELLEM